MIGIVIADRRSAVETHTEPGQGLVGQASETVSILSRIAKSCHDQGCHLFYRPHPNPLPEGEGVLAERLIVPSPFGRGTQGEGIRATISLIPRV